MSEQPSQGARDFEVAAGVLVTDILRGVFGSVLDFPNGLHTQIVNAMTAAYERGKKEGMAWEPEPSQGARRRAEQIYCDLQGMLDKCTAINHVQVHIATAEQAAFQRGREEGRREAAQIVVKYSKEYTPGYPARDLADEIHKAILATDPLAGRAAPEPIPEECPCCGGKAFHFKCVGCSATWVQPIPGQPAATMETRLADIEARLLRLEEKE